jgi:tetratricopeptide (TPR) repeat protein
VKDYDRALTDYGHAISLNPRLVAAYINRGRVYQAKGDILRANADFNAAKQIER